MSKKKKIVAVNICWDTIHSLVGRSRINTNEIYKGSECVWQYTILYVVYITSSNLYCYYVTYVPTTQAPVLLWSVLLVDGAARTCFLSAHVPRSPLELFYDVWKKLFLCLNDVFQSTKLNFSRSGIHAKILYWLYSGTVMWLMKQQFGNPPTHNFTGGRKHLADP